MLERHSPTDGEILARNLVAEFFRDGNFTAARGPVDPRSIENLLAASYDNQQTMSPEYGLNDLAVQAVGYNRTSEAEEVRIYVSRGGRSILNKLSQNVDGVRIQLQNVGPLSVKLEATVSGNSQIGYFTRNDRITCGSSCVPAGQHYAGTFGALVESQGDMLALSNNHVFAACNHVPVGQPILSPSPLDSTPFIPPPRQFCRHLDIVELRSGDPGLVPPSQCDAAIATVPDPDIVTSWQGDPTNGFDTPALARLPGQGMRVKKVGRTTGLTHGVVDINVLHPIPVPYTNSFFNGVVWFNDVWSVLGDGGQPFALPGDSGSLVVTENGDAAIGLVFAISGRGATYISPLPTILSQLNLRLVNGHGI